MSVPANPVSPPAGRSRPRLVGHKGAAHLAPGNTRESFDAALSAGVDMVEFDVLSEHLDGSGALLVAHDYQALAASPRLTFEQALEHLAGESFSGVELDVDIKLPGYGTRVVGGLREAGLLERSLVSCAYAGELEHIRRTEPGLRLGLSVPRVRRDYTANLLTVAPALVALKAFRAALPRRATSALNAGRFDAVMAHWRVVTPALVRAVAQGKGELYAWTIDDLGLMRRLIDMGVDGIITNDPYLLARL
jgi:glycerophosphoryl diester phosphodiesterase